MRLFIEFCGPCVSEKKATRRNKAPLQSYIAGALMDRIQIDVLGPLPESTSGNKYVLVIIDQFSKWVQAYALPHQGSELVAEKLIKEFIAVFGVPLKLHTDQGSNSQSELFKEVCKLLPITLLRMGKSSGLTGHVGDVTYKQWPHFSKHAHNKKKK